MQQPTFQDKEEARKIIQGQGTLFTFDENGYLQMPNGKKPSHEYSQQHRGVQAAVVDLLLACNPQGDRFLLDAKEALTDQMKAIAESFADMSDEHPVNTLAYITEDMRIFADDTEEDHTKGWIDRWADVLRCEETRA